MVALHFHRPFSFIGRLVGLWTCSAWVHVGIEHEINGVSCVTEATNANGIVVRRADKARPPDAVVEIPWLADEAVTTYLIQYWGATYGWRDVIGFTTGSNHNFGGVQCAELVSLVLQTAIPCVGAYDMDRTYEPIKGLLSSKPVSRVSPADLARVLGLV